MTKEKLSSESSTAVLTYQELQNAFNDRSSMQEIGLIQLEQEVECRKQEFHDLTRSREWDHHAIAREARLEQYRKQQQAERRAEKLRLRQRRASTREEVPENDQQEGPMISVESHAIDAQQTQSPSREVRTAPGNGPPV